MKEKKRKGIGFAVILILLPIPGMIIYGLVTDSFDFAHGFVYGCIVSLVFLRNQAGILGSSSAEMKAFHLCMP